MNVELKEKPKTLARKGDFPLEIRVFFNSQGRRYGVSSYGGWIEAEKAWPGELDVFDKAPEKVIFGDEYQRVSDIKLEGNIRQVTYLNTTYPSKVGEDGVRRAL